MRALARAIVKEVRVREEGKGKKLADEIDDGLIANIQSRISGWVVSQLGILSPFEFYMTQTGKDLFERSTR